MDVNNLLQNKRYLFWGLQLAGWSSWGITFYLGMAFWGKADTAYAVYLPIVSTLGMAISLLLRALYRATWNAEIGWRVFTVLLGSYLAGAAWMVSRASIFRLLFSPQMVDELEKGEGFWARFEGTTSAFMVMVVWSALYFGIKFYLMMQEEQQRRLKAVSMAHEAQLKMLQYQLNPHFLFNTLNAISTLILDNETRQANSMVTRLSRFLRYSLDNDPMQKVTVAEEIEALKLYLDIEKVRFDERLNLIFDVDPAAQSALVPGLLLQPLVENSIKYAIAQAIHGGSIQVSARLSGDRLSLTVADDGPGLGIRDGSLPRGGGVGLSNCRGRLEELYGDRQSFHLGTTEPHGLTVTIEIPLEEGSSTA